MRGDPPDDWVLAIADHPLDGCSEVPHRATFRAVPPPSLIEASCSRTQESIWLAEQVSDVAPASNLPLGITVNGPVDVLAVQAAVDSVVAAQPMLRTRFAVREGRLVHAVTTHATGVLPVAQIALGSETELGRHIEATSRRPLDLLDVPYTIELIECPRDA